MLMLSNIANMDTIIFLLFIYDECYNIIIPVMNVIVINYQLLSW